MIGGITLKRVEDVTDVKMEKHKDDGRVDRHTLALEETPCSSDRWMRCS